MGGRSELPEVPTRRLGETSGNCQEVLRAAQDTFAGESAGGREPLQAIRNAAAEAAKCRLGVLENTRLALQ